MNITDIRTCDLKPYENNPRLNEDAVDLVAASIEEFGFKQPIVVDKDLIIIAGSTLMACEQLGRRCFMMEYDPHYADVIIKRWEDYTGEQAELIEDAC